MKNKKFWLAMGIVILTLCLSSCNQTNVNDKDSTKEENETTTEVHVHTLSSGVQENVVEPTCEKVGSYDEVVYCSVCKEEVSRTKNSLAIRHQFDNKKCMACGIDQPSDGLNFLSNGNGTCMVSGIGSCKDEDVIIPTFSPNGDKVIGISASAFSACEGLKSVRIPDTVVIIGKGAFQECPDLVSVTLSRNITTIADFTFKDCKSLKNVTIPSRVTQIGKEAFDYCVAFESIVIPANVKVIGINAFRNFSSCDGTVKFEKTGGWWLYDSLGNAEMPVDLTGDEIRTELEKSSIYITWKYCEYEWRRN